MILSHWLNRAISSLNANGSDSSRCDAEIILETVTKKPRSYFLAFNDKFLSTQQIVQADMLLMRRMKGEPIAYLTGVCEFWTLKLNVFPGMFIPRPDTECLVEQVLLNFSEDVSLKVLDLGTGSGAIALSIALERPMWKVTGVDFLLKSVNLARKNANLLRIKNAIFVLGNWFDDLEKFKYDIIVSNPPYIATNDPHLLRGDVRFEDKTSLISENEGLADLFYICRCSDQYLKRGGWLVLEHGWLQGNDIRKCFVQSGFKHVTTIRDYNNNERVTYGKFFGRFLR